MRMVYVGNDEHTDVHGQHKRSKSASGTIHALRAGGASHSKEDRNKSTVREINSKQGLRSDARSSVLHSSLHESNSNKDTDVASNQKDSLEKDIEQLQMRLQQEKSMRMLLERALGRTSSSLSPGHRHSANHTKGLIAEIELLEEEVVNREQHVLSLYRSIFEQCVSSKQTSVQTSPAHAMKKESISSSRKHPTIISSTFCSSKTFPFRNFHALSTMNAGKGSLLHSKIRHSKANSCSDEIVKEMKGNQSSSRKKPCLQLSLKDHLYECPSRLSEEMVKCMATAYCWLRTPSSSSSSSSSSTTNKKSSSLSITNGEDCKSMVEICWISTHNNNFSRASYAINSYRVLVEQLERLNLSQMETNAQTAFWINMYNSMIMHAYLAYGIPHSSLRRLALFHKAAYKISGHVISANAIEQAILRLRTPRVGKWLETILSTALWKKCGEERQRISTELGLENYQPLLCFALCTGTSSDPVLKVYTASNIKEELELAKREFLESNIMVKKSKKVLIPKLLERFGKEANICQEGLLKWIMENVDKKQLRDSIEKCMEHNKGVGGKKTSHTIEWMPYDSRFRKKESLYIYDNWSATLAISSYD
ncbi:unnamed protein product [Lactuca virosa]|uniref:DUF547 domain-containing protein n=1 Tax=Lactuca virosa TaxID=75947 RepID=A0AAU9PP06_9ASTR|nr:unnamed protein product [Lactuca virosa]